MAEFASDDDPDSAAMAEAMGFTGFGMQRAKKRKLTPPAQTGANNAPLGKRRPLNLPQPVVSGEGNAEEIDLDDDDGDVEGAQGGGAEADEDSQAQAGLDALTFSDAPPATARPHHSLPPKPQQHQQHQSQHHHAGKAARHPSGRAGGGPGQAAWWEGEWDPRLVSRMVENPWDRLEKQRGLGARGTWPTPRGARDGGDAAATSFGAGGGLAGTSDGGAAVGFNPALEPQAA